MTDGVRIKLALRIESQPATLICPEHDENLVWESELCRYRCPVVPCYIGITDKELKQIAKWIMDNQPVQELQEGVMCCFTHNEVTYDTTGMDRSLLCQCPCRLLGDDPCRRKAVANGLCEICDSEFEFKEEIPQVPGFTMSMSEGTITRYIKNRYGQPWPG